MLHLVNVKLILMTLYLWVVYNDHHNLLADLYVDNK